MSKEITKEIASIAAKKMWTDHEIIETLRAQVSQLTKDKEVLTVNMNFETHRANTVEQQVSQLTRKLAEAELIIGLWNATFSKYESWMANGAKCGQWPEQVLADYRECSQYNKKSDALAELLRPVREALSLGMSLCEHGLPMGPTEGRFYKLCQAALKALGADTKSSEG